MKTIVKTKKKNRKMVKELITRINSYNEDIIMVLCDCGCTDHHLIITKDRNELKGTYYVTIVPAAMDIWNRIRHAWRILTKGPYTDTIVLNQVEIKALDKALKEIMK